MECTFNILYVRSMHKIELACSYSFRIEGIAGVLYCILLYSALLPIDLSSLGSCVKYTIEIKIGYPTIRSVVLLVGPIFVTPYAVIPESGIPSLGRPVLLGNNIYAASTEPLTVYCWPGLLRSLSLSTHVLFYLLFIPILHTIFYYSLLLLHHCSALVPYIVV